jgi:dolichol-phosphate mannosyltransferase
MIEMAYRAHRRGANVRQVPITFMNRRAGASKMSGLIFAEALVQVVKLRITELARRRRGTRTSR